MVNEIGSGPQFEKVRREDIPTPRPSKKPEEMTLNEKIQVVGQLLGKESVVAFTKDGAQANNVRSVIRDMVETAKTDHKVKIDDSKILQSGVQGAALRVLRQMENDDTYHLDLNKTSQELKTYEKLSQANAHKTYDKILNDLLHKLQKE